MNNQSLNNELVSSTLYHSEVDEKEKKEEIKIKTEVNKFNFIQIYEK